MCAKLSIFALAAFLLILPASASLGYAQGAQRGAWELREPLDAGCESRRRDDNRDNSSLAPPFRSSARVVRRPECAVARSGDPPNLCVPTSPDSTPLYGFWDQSVQSISDPLGCLPRLFMFLYAIRGLACCRICVSERIRFLPRSPSPLFSAAFRGDMFFRGQAVVP
jgi:hypothetical protein